MTFVQFKMILSTCKTWNAKSLSNDFKVRYFWDTFWLKYGIPFLLWESLITKFNKSFLPPFLWFYFLIPIYETFNFDSLKKKYFIDGSSVTLWYGSQQQQSSWAQKLKRSLHALLSSFKMKKTAFGWPEQNFRQCFKRAFSLMFRFYLFFIAKSFWISEMSWMSIINKICYLRLLKKFLLWYILKFVTNLQSIPSVQVFKCPECPEYPECPVSWVFTVWTI